MRLNIKHVRESRGMKKTELAKKAGITRATLWKLETEDNPTTTTDTLTKIASALNCQVADLILPV